MLAMNFIICSRVVNLRQSVCPVPMCHQRDLSTFKRQCLNVYIAAKAAKSASVQYTQPFKAVVCRVQRRKERECTEYIPAESASVKAHIDAISASVPCTQPLLARVSRAHSRY